MELDRTDEYSLSEDELKEAVQDYFKKITKFDVPSESIAFNAGVSENGDLSNFTVTVTISKHKTI